MHLFKFWTLKTSNVSAKLWLTAHTYNFSLYYTVLNVDYTSILTVAVIGYITTL